MDKKKYIEEANKMLSKAYIPYSKFPITQILWGSFLRLKR